MGNCPKRERTVYVPNEEKEIVEKKEEDYQWSMIDIPLEKIQTQTPKYNFSILSYNILADCHIHHLQNFVDKKFRDFSYRSPRVVKILENTNSDIIMLQEVDNFTRYYKGPLEKLGYELLFQTKDNFNGEGCVIGYKSDLLELKEKKILKFDSGHPYEKEYQFRKGSIAIHAVLKHKSSGKIINVICTHLYWDPKFEHVKYLQMSQIIKHANQQIKNDEIIVWGGDLNSKIEHNLMQYVLKGEAPIEEKLEGFNSPQKMKYELEIYQYLKKYSIVKWENPYQFYGDALQRTDLTYPKYTNYSVSFKGTIDHIVYKKDSLVPLKLLKLPEEPEIKNKTLPNRRFPSDHLPVMVLFGFN